MTGNPAQRKRNTDDTRRDARLRLRAWLWEHTSPSTGLRVSECGRKRVSNLVQIRANSEVGAAGLGGVSTCGSVWACPACSAKVAQTRSDEVQDTIRAWQARGGSVLLVTLTLRHRLGFELARTWDALGNGWATVRNGSGWRKDVESFGIAGYCRVVEVTHSRRHGWHPHMHVLVFVKGTPTDEDCSRLRGRLYGRWSRRLAREGYSTLEFDRDGHAVGVDVRRADAHTVEYLAGYLAKFGYVPKGNDPASESDENSWSLAREVARGDLKRGRKGSRTPWELLEDAAEGSKAAQRLWAVWEAASKGRRQYAWAAGFRESLDLPSLKTDAEVAEAEDNRLEVVALVPAGSWSTLVADLRRTRHAPGRSLLSKALQLGANGPAADLRDWLASVGVEVLDPADVAAEGEGTPLHFDTTTATPRLAGSTKAGSWNLRDQVRRSAPRPTAAGRSLEGDGSDPWLEEVDHGPEHRVPPQVQAHRQEQRNRPVSAEAERLRRLYGV